MRSIFLLWPQTDLLVDIQFISSLNYIGKYLKCIWSEHHCKIWLEFCEFLILYFVRFTYNISLQYSMICIQQPQTSHNVSSFCMPWEQVLFFDDHNKTSNPIPFVIKLCTQIWTIVVFKYFGHQLESFFPYSLYCNNINVEMARKNIWTTLSQIGGQRFSSSYWFKV